MKQINLEKQFRFAIASALTKTAKSAQGAAIGEIKSTFTVRNNWLTSPIGPKILPATKTDLSAAVVLKTDILNLHEDGGIKLPSGTFIAIPTSNVRRRKNSIVATSDRPRNLSGKAFVLPLKSGGRGGGGKGKLGIFVRVNGRVRNKYDRPTSRKRKVQYTYQKSALKLMYILVPHAKIEERPTVTTAAMKTFEKQFSNTLFQELKNALATAR